MMNLTIFKIHNVFNLSFMLKSPSILYIVQSNLHFECLKYRVLNIQEYLKANNIISTVIFDKSLDSKTVFNYILESSIKIIVFYRTTWTPQIEKFIDNAKKHGKKIVYDIDDYIFDEKIIPQIDFIESQSSKHKDSFSAEIPMYKRCLLLCNYFIGTTNSLANIAGKLGLKSFIIRNGINKKEINSTEKLLKKRSSIINSKSGIIISYLSGSSSHKEDIRVVLKPLEKILDKYSHVKLKIIGMCEIPQDFQKKFKKRIIRRGFMSWQKVLNNLVDVNINIYPLKQNQFRQGKSELKYFQTALLKIPTVATPIESFKSAITNGENGFLAENDEDWKKYLEKLIKSSSLRKKIGQNAHKHSIKKYYQDMPKNVFKVYNIILEDNKTNKVEEYDKQSSFFPLLILLVQKYNMTTYFLRIYIKRHIIYKLPFKWQRQIFYLYKKITSIKYMQ